MKKLTIWIVGASSGIGLELTKRWLSDGHYVIASSRNATTVTALQELLFRYPNKIILINIDITSNTDLVSSIEEAWNGFGQIDRWFYNAGVYEVMKIEEWTMEAFEQMNATNYLGAVRLMIPLSQKFLTQGYGEWVWNSSLSSYFGLPYGGAYSAPKAALLNLAESIQPELASKNITLRIINHGFVKTRLTSKNNFQMPQLMEPSYAAAQIADALENSQGFEIRFPKFLSGFLALLRHLPYRFSLALTRKALR